MKLLFWTYFFLLATSVNSNSDNEQDSGEASDNEDLDDKLPEHEFLVDEKVIKSGANKGQKKFTVTLMVPVIFLGPNFHGIRAYLQDTIINFSNFHSNYLQESQITEFFIEIN